MFDRVPLNLCLNRSVFNALLGKIHPEDYSDVKAFQYIDVNVANSLSFIMNNKIDDMGDALELYFTITKDSSG